MSNRRTLLRTPKCGPIEGFESHGAAFFLGLPYAKPLRGKDRFLEPQALDSWSETYQAFRYGPTAPQPVREFTLIPEPLEEGDTYLNLNIFAPIELPIEALPVMIYFHGGGYWAGCNRSPWFEGDSFVRNGVIVVSPSYRLGIEGFLPLDGAPDNRALLDWIAALEWVKTNIAAFGGDPARVTIAGQSAGGGAVANLLASPTAKGLFHRAALFSGNIGFRGNRPRTLEYAKRFQKALNKPLDIETLAALSSEEIVLTQEYAKTLQADSRPGEAIVRNARDGIALQPIPGTPSLPIKPEDAYATGMGTDVPVLLTSTKDEFAFELEPLGESITTTYVNEACEKLNLVPSAFRQSYPGYNNARLIAQLVTDRLFRAPMINMADIRTLAATAPTWVAEFQYQAETVYKSPLRASHCLDMPYFFNKLALDSVKKLCGVEAPQTLADEMHNAIVSFVKGQRLSFPPWSDVRSVHVWGESPASASERVIKDLSYMPDVQFSSLASC